MKKAQETKNVKGKSENKSKLTLKHQIVAYGVTIIILTAYFYILYLLHISSSIWTILGAIVIAVIILPISQNLIYPK
jgi:small neutral amino acid transporter SnatA (MarC family)